jgi:hypothetical protein
MKYQKEEAVAMVKFLRFRLDDPATAKCSYMGYLPIARFLNKSTTYVQKICEELVSRGPERQERNARPSENESFFERYRVKKEQNFSKEQVSFLSSKRRLILWATKSMAERVALLKRWYPGMKVSQYKLRKLYYQLKIKKKMIRLTKIPSRDILER